MPTAPVHPRVRGERFSKGGDDLLDAGSSPRARGTDQLGAGPGRRKRFIPACAGNGDGYTQNNRLHPVHPRVRGERTHPAVEHPEGFGSSPRARGTECQHGPEPGSSRFIPACAGNGPHPGPARRRASVHPRVRGERPCLRFLAHARSGSSPRARGTAEWGERGGAGIRFIPACAGNGPAVKMALRS